MLGLAADVMAQSSPPTTTVPGSSGQAMLLQNGSQMNGVVSGVSTNT
jgi:hypothetical protein